MCVRLYLAGQAPVFFAAAVYLALKHAINLNEDNLRVSPVKRVFVTIFIVMDTITTIVQVAGAALVGRRLFRSSSGTHKLTSQYPHPPCYAAS
jgi:hypothetical protein